MGISSIGIGTNGLDVNGIIAKLMAVEAAPLASLDKKSASYLSKVTAFGTLSGALSTFQSSLTGLTTLSNFQTLSANSSDATIMSGSAKSNALPGNYKVDISQLAQAQTLASGGYKSSTSAIGLGATTTLNFQLGEIVGGTFGLSGSQISAGMLTSGLTPGGLTINNTAIATDGSTRSARQLADAINAKSGTTGVSATAAPTKTSATLFANFGAVDTGGGGSYALSVGGVTIASQTGAGTPIDAASLDAALTGDTAVTRALAEANITVEGSAVDGTLQFVNSDGSNVNVSEIVTGTVSGGIDNNAANTGSSTTAMSAVSLVSSNGSQITVGGSNPIAAGLTAGTSGAYSAGTFTQDAKRASANIVIDSKNNTLAGIRDAINKANFGVKASIISDGSATPNHLVLTSTETGVTSTMKISLNGANGNPPDPDLVALLGYDPSGTQNMKQTSSALDTKALVNGIPVFSPTTTISGALEGLTFNANKVGTASLTVAKDTTALTASINGFVKAYNDLNNQIKSLNGYDTETKTGGPLLGDSTVQSLQARLRGQLSMPITGLKGDLTNLAQVGVSFQKDGSLTLDSAKLNKAIANNFDDIAGLFAVVGQATDANITFTSSSAKTVAGDYAINITKLATQAGITSSAPLADTTVIAADTTWNVKLNDTVPPNANNTASISLPPGSYTKSELTSMLQAAINGHASFASAGSTVAVTLNDDGTLKMTTNKYGSKSNLGLTSDTGTPVSALFGGNTPVNGVDVEGTIGGYSATGDGQSLTGAPGAPVDGLKLEIKGDALGSRGTIGFSQGYAYQLNTLSSSFLGAKGVLAGRTSGLNTSVQDIAKQKTAFNAKLVEIEARYRKQYTALDVTLANLSTTSSYLTQQLAALAANN